MTCSILSRCSAALVASLLLAASPTLAASGKDPLEAQARDEFKKGQTAYNLGHFEDARQAYSEAYRLKAHPALLFNIAQCERQLGNWEKAAFGYRRFMELMPEGTDFGTARALLAEMEQKQRDEDARAEEQRRLEEAKALAQAEAAAKARREAELLKQPPPLAHPPPVAVEEEAPVYKKWWFWTGIGAAVVGGTVIAVAATSSSDPRPVSLGTLDTR